MNILIPMSKLILVTGANGRFAQVLKKENTLLNLKFYNTH